MFSVVHFKDTNEMEVVHKNWLISDSSCAWPPFISPTKIKKLLLAGTLPSNTWQPNEILVIGHYDTLEKAEKFRDDLSDIVMNIKTEVVEPPPKPAKRHKPTPVIVPLTASVNDDCESQNDNTRSPSDDYALQLALPYTDTPNAEGGNLNNGVVLNVSDEPTGTQRKIMSMMTKMNNKLDYLMLNVNLLLKNDPIEEMRIYAGKDELPLKSVDDVRNFEKKLDTEFKKWVQILGNKGGSNVEQATRRVMANLMTNDCACHFNWAGRGDKHPIKSLKIYTLVLSAVRKNSNIKFVADVAVEETVKSWLKQAKTRSNYIKKK